MREILFRGKDKYKGSWVKGFYYIKRSRYAGDKTFISEKHIITTGIEETSGAYGENTEYIECNVIPETIGQYTGLTDKNGKKIFEGDILKVERDFWHGENKKEREIFISVVCYDERSADFGLKGAKYMNLTMHRFKGDYQTVIGNIHDNPELLKGGEG